MLERIREGAQGPWAMVIVGLIIMSFVFAGVGSYLSAPTTNAVAKVNGEEIAASEVERAYQNQRAQMEAQFGEGVSALFSDPTYLAQFKDQALQQLIGDLLLKQHAESLGLRVSDEQVKEAITAIPQFQVGGVFSNDRYLVAIRQSGFQPSEFREYIRREMTRDQLSRALGGSGFALSNAAKLVAQLEQQTRDAKILTLESSAFSNDIEVTDEEIQIYYDANLNRFDTEEKVSLAYVELDVETLKKDILVNEQEVATYYDEHLSAYQTEEKRAVSHILVEFNDDKDAALERITVLKERINNGEAFEEVASAESDDTFSAENGGDLGEITEGLMGEAFESAVFNLANVGDVSEPVETDFGYHLIKATSIKLLETQPLSEVSAEIEETIKQDKALDEFYRLQTEMSQLAFEVSDSLEEVAESINGKVQTTGLLTRSFAPSPFDRGDIAAVAFSDELIEEQVNSDVIEITDEHVLVMRVIEHEPQRTKSLDEVSDQIVSTLKTEKAQDASRTWAESFIETYQTDVSAAASLLIERGVDWSTRVALTRSTSDLPSTVRNTLFSMSTASPENIEVVDLGIDSVAVVLLTAVNSVDSVSAETIEQYKQRLAAESTNVEVAALIDALKEEASIKLMAEVEN
ncbi:SurA N-terminal domain-containing protein [Alteromonas sp. 5E99-2]|uniref:SurA N-terminal domain-containing protein n=1 Tax=Alteromonas sp. 5E99-2 TaxID=2817683 RepID=UPI001A9979AA|nr:SurA N-terminal domain-containing protein [Alteromonas sp. 5E99-2]MBO1255335.1 SurA N-terminal domain-containing protein [Alteromonas sp. 5E99-2]